MSDHYDETVAAHYAAYRPPLHLPILKRALTGTERFAYGLDVGCGTGRSSVALAHFCERVAAVDPSQAMIDGATFHSSISYSLGSAECLPPLDDAVDVVTFAGSLFYADLNRTVEELCRICRPTTLVVPYDFRLCLDDVLHSFGMTKLAVSSNYNPAVNFSGIVAFKEMLVQHDHIELSVSPVDVAHILLADRARHDAFVDRYRTESPLLPLASDLGSDRETITICAEIYFSVYQPDYSSGELTE